MISRLTCALRRELMAWVDQILAFTPGQTGMYLRGFRAASLFGTDSRRLHIAPGVFVEGYNNIKLNGDLTLGKGCSIHSAHGKILIGDGLSLNHGVWIGADFGAITIGSGVIIGPYTVLRAANHKVVRGVPMKTLGHEYGEITVGDNVWIGANATVVSGANIGSNSVVAAGAVVIGDIPPNTICGGVPARVIKEIS